MPVTVSTKSRLERIVRPFELVVSKGRKFAPSAGMVPAIVSVACDNWQESSIGDGMHKAILVLEGQVDIEGASGGWLVIPNHIIFVPAHRSFNLRTTRKTHVVVAHLHPDDHLWHHHGCWVTQANALAVQYFSYVLTASAREAGAGNPAPVVPHLLTYVPRLVCQFPHPLAAFGEIGRAAAFHQPCARNLQASRLPRPATPANSRRAPCSAFRSWNFPLASRR